MSNHSKKTVRTEANILNDCLIALSEAGCLAWRNNTGKLQDKQGRWVTFGLCLGSSDIIGIAPGGIFFAVECKKIGGAIRPAQWTFIKNVKAKGGRAGFAYNSQEAVDIALALRAG